MTDKAIAIFAVALVLAWILGTFLWIEVKYAARCTCKDSDNCTCGGAHRATVVPTDAAEPRHLPHFSWWA